MVNAIAFRALTTTMKAYHRQDLITSITKLILKKLNFVLIDDLIGKLFNIL